MPSNEWLITGKQTQEWAAADAVLPALNLDHPQVAFARALIVDILRDNASDAQVVVDLFEPFSYLLTESARLEAILGSDTAAANDAAAAAAQASLQGASAEAGAVMDVSVGDASFSNPVKLLSAAMAAPQALSLEECDRLLRQYSSTIAVLERAIPDLRVSLKWPSRLCLSQSPCFLTAAIRYCSSVRANKRRASGVDCYRRGTTGHGPCQSGSCSVPPAKQALL